MSQGALLLTESGRYDRREEMRASEAQTTRRASRNQLQPRDEFDMRRSTGLFDRSGLLRRLWDAMLCCQVVLTLAGCGRIGFDLLDVEQGSEPDSEDTGTTDPPGIDSGKVDANTVDSDIMDALDSGSVDMESGSVDSGRVDSGADEEVEGGCQSPLADVVDGLVGFWSLNEASEAVAADTSGANHHGVLTNMVGNEWTLGKAGNALSFDGTDDFVSIGDTGAVAKSVAFWMNASVSSGSSVSADTGLETATQFDAVSWINPHRAYISDDSYALMSGAPKSEAWANFSLSGVSGIVVGIEVKIEKRATDSSGNYGLAAELSWNGGSTYSASGKSAFFTNTVDDILTFGGSADTWGRTWSASDLSNANFRVRLTGSVPGNASSKAIYVDRLTVKVHYSLSGGSFGAGPTLPAGGDNCSVDSSGRPWGTPGWACLTDTGKSASCSLATDCTNNWWGFSFPTIPAGAAITGIEARLLIRASDVGHTGTASVALSWDGGATFGTSVKSTTLSYSATYPTVIFGGSADLWGTSHIWTPADFNAADNFRIRVTGRSDAASFAVRMDSLAVTIYYSTPTSADTGDQPASAYVGASPTNWFDPANAYASDDAYASMSGTSRDQAWSTFGLAVPAGAIIKGIEIVVEKQASDTSGSYMLAAELSYGAGAFYTATGKSVSFTNTADDTYIFGSSADSWGRAWSSADLSDANFRVRLRGAVPGNSVSRYINVDRVAARVSYATISATTPIIDLGSGARIEVDPSQNLIVTGFSAPSVYVNGAPGAAVGVGTWYYVVVTDATGVSASALKLANAGATYFGGVLDEVRIYDRVLTAGEISRLAGSAACP